MNLQRRLRTLIQRRRDPIAWARSIGVTVGDNCRLLDVKFGSEPYLVTLGDHVSATRTRFETHDGGVWVLRGDDPDIDIIKPVTVGSNVYFGDGCIVMPGITIGDNVIVGAGAIVTKDIPSDSVAVGVPAKVIKTIDEYRAGVAADRLPTKQLDPAAKKSWLLDHYNR